MKELPKQWCNVSRATEMGDISNSKYTSPRAHTVAHQNPNTRLPGHTLRFIKPQIHISQGTHCNTSNPKYTSPRAHCDTSKPKYACPRAHTVTHQNPNARLPGHTLQHIKPQIHVSHGTRDRETHKTPNAYMSPKLHTAADIKPAAAAVVILTLRST